MKTTVKDEIIDNKTTDHSGIYEAADKTVE